jgi:serine/threonine protein kinase
VLHQIGVGALGPVFRTYEPTRDRLVAVKVFRLDVTPEQASALADELTRATEAGLFHPSIVEPVAAGMEGTVAYRAEEYVAAESLDVAMRHYAPAGLDKVLPFISQLASAIDFARAAGVGHGALHPRDIFVTPDEARATGFGVVDALDRLGLRAPVRRPYSPPERIAGNAWSTPADVFSLGVIAFELLTSRRPSGLGEQMGPLTGATLGDRVDAIREVLAKAMHELPAERYATAGAFAGALAAAGGAAALPSFEPATASGAIVTGDTALMESIAQPPIAAADQQSPTALDDFAAEPAPPAPGESAREVARKVIAARKRQHKPNPELFLAPPEPDTTELSSPSGVAAGAFFGAARPESTLELEQEEATSFAPAIDAEPTPAVTEDVPVQAEAEAAPEIIASASTEEEEEEITPLEPPSDPDRAGLSSLGLTGSPFKRIEVEPDEPAVDTTLRDSSDRIVAVDEFRARESNGLRAERGRLLTPDRPTSDRSLPSRPSPIDPIDRHIPLLPAHEPGPDRARVAMLPLAVMLVLGLLLGYTAGYVVGNREQAQEVARRSTARPEAASATPGTTGQAPPKAFSDQVVSPGAAPPAQPQRSAAAAPTASARSKPGAAPVARERGRLLVRSTPSRADVTINGKWSGRTPLTLDDQAFGQYTIRVVQRGFEAAREEVELSRANPTQTMEVTLRRPAGRAEKPAPAPRPKPAAPPAASKPAATSGEIYVDSRPQGARVVIDGKDVGVTPLRLTNQALGHRTVRLELTDHQVWTTTTRVVAGETARVTGSLERIR